MTDSTELYYSEMEAARSDAEYQYFAARPQLRYTTSQKTLFCAGFERAFRLLWKEPTAPETSAAQPDKKGTQDGN